MRLYTRTGDKGETGLYGGSRAGKDALRVEAYGTVDELNCVLGLAAAECDLPPIADMLTRLQARLFDLGADLCTPVETNAPKKVRITDRHVAELEELIDRACAELRPLDSFILPGGTVLAARLHLARAVSRRAERRVVALARNEQLGDNVIPYLNRVSDLLFALARLANQQAHVPDVPWRPE